MLKRLSPRLILLDRRSIGSDEGRQCYAREEVVNDGNAGSAGGDDRLLPLLRSLVRAAPRRRGAGSAGLLRPLLSGGHRGPGAAGESAGCARDGLEPAGPAGRLLCPVPLTAH